MTNQKTPEPRQHATEEQIEAAAKALAQMEQGGEWEDFDDREFFRRRARSALEAAISASASADPADEHHDAEEHGTKNPYWNPPISDEEFGRVTEPESEDHAAAQESTGTGNTFWSRHIEDQTTGEVSVAPEFVPLVGDREKLIAAVLELAVKTRYKADRWANDLGEIALGDVAYADTDLLRDAAAALAAPVEVDEAKLAEVELPLGGGRFLRLGSGPARFLAEWLRGEGR